MADRSCIKKRKNPYYCLLENENVVDSILGEFGLPHKDSRIVNGHVPVLQRDGESPVKCNGKVLVIDGGFSKAYQNQTGIAGYTLTYNSYGLSLVAPEPFTSTEDAITEDGYSFESDYGTEDALSPVSGGYGQWTRFCGLGSKN